MDDTIPPSEQALGDLPPSENPDFGRRLSRSMSVRSSVRTSVISSAPELNNSISHTTGSRSETQLFYSTPSLEEKTNNDRKLPEKEVSEANLQYVQKFWSRPVSRNGLSLAAISHNKPKKRHNSKKNKKNN